MLTRQALAQWLALYPALPAAVPRNVLIIMAGNIPFVGIHDLICVLAAGHRAMVKPSSRDFDNMSWAVGQLLDIAPEVPVSLFSEDSPTPDAVIAMGSNDTVAAISEKYAGAAMLLRGSRSSPALLSGGESAGELEGLADDVLMYSGLGCRNVSLVFVPRGYDFSKLQNVMRRREERLNPNYRNNCRQVRALLRMRGMPHVDCGACLLVEGRDFPGEPSILHYAYYDTLPQVVDWLAEHDDEIQCVACSPQLAAGFGRGLADIHPRAVVLGETQHPHLTDYPDGRDTMRFLMTI